MLSEGISIYVYDINTTGEDMKDLLITMEGPDGAGKSTQIALLKDYLEGRGYRVLVTRDPGGNPTSEAIREIILNKEYTRMSYMTELLLYAAARAQLVAEVIRPALDEDMVVICDRFVDSSAVYQGIARGMGIDTVYEVNEYALQGISPLLTIHMDLEAEEGIRRKRNQAELDRMEACGLEFHKRVAEGYRTLAAKNTGRIVTIDASLPIKEIHGKIIKAVDSRIINSVKN